MKRLVVLLAAAPLAAIAAGVRAAEEGAAGRADVGTGGADTLLARDRGEGLVVLASVFQQSAAERYALAPARPRSRPPTSPGTLR